jgi:hypothetical protein
MDLKYHWRGERSRWFRTDPLGEEEKDEKECVSDSAF